MMMQWNVYAWAVLAIVLGLYLLDLISDLLNLSALSDQVPTELAGVYDGEKYARSQQYTRTTTRFGLAEASINLMAFLAFWLLGGFSWWDQTARSWTSHPLATGLVFLFGLGLFSYLLGLPATIVHTFWVEEKFGFNRSNWRTFWGDQLKSLLLAVIVGAPLLAAILWFFQTWPNQAWWIVWLTVSGFSLLLSYVAPHWILPLFNKFEPLTEGELKERIEGLAKACQFPLKEIWIMDGSRRSSKSNAFFTGFGKHKRIALFDTLVESQTTDELVAVLAHEIGHFKRHHIHQQIGLGVLQVGVMCYLLNWVIKNPAVFAAFGVADLSIYASLTFFTILFRPVSRLLGIAMSVWSRKNEFEADHYAATSLGSPDPLIGALKKLSVDNLVNLTPHPFYVFMNYSHPPMKERIAALSGQRA